MLVTHVTVHFEEGIQDKETHLLGGIKTRKQVSKESKSANLEFLDGVIAIISVAKTVTKFAMMIFQKFPTVLVTE